MGGGKKKSVFMGALCNLVLGDTHRQRKETQWGRGEKRQHSTVLYSVVLLMHCLRFSSGLSICAVTPRMGRLLQRHNFEMKNE